MKHKTPKRRSPARGLSERKQALWKPAAGKKTAEEKARAAKAVNAGPARRIPDRVVNNLYEAKLNLSRLVDRAAAGEEIVIAKNGKPMAKLVPLPPQPKRVPGGWEGKVWIADDFNDPLPDGLLDLFEGKSDEAAS